MAEKMKDFNLRELANRPSLTGHGREHYKELQRKKEEELGTRLIGSLGFCRRSLLDIVEWVNVFDASKTYRNTDEIIAACKKELDGAGIEIAQAEHDGDEFRIWLCNKQKPRDRHVQREWKTRKVFVHNHFF